MTPDFQILANGADITALLNDRLTALTIVDAAGMKSDTAQISLDDRDHAIELPAVGAVLEIALGFKETGLLQMGKFIVDEISGSISPETLTIHAKAANMLGGIKAPKTRGWEGVTLGELVETMAGEYGLDAAVSDTLKDIPLGFIAQTAESDLNVLTRLARQFDATAKPVGNALVFVKRGAGKTAAGNDIPAVVLTRDRLQNGSWKVTSRGTFKKVIAEWVDLLSGNKLQVTAGDGEPVKTMRHAYASESEAQIAADGALSRSRRASGQIKIAVAGFQGDLCAEGTVELQGIKEELTGGWSVTRVEHRLSGALTTNFEAERDNEGTDE